MSAARRILVIVLLGVAALALSTRALLDLRIPTQPGGDASFTVDADSHYHMRRLERALDEGLPVAETDPLLDFPHGSAIPWPPYYTYALYATLAPFAPSEHAARVAFVERNVALAPWFEAALAAVVVALAAWRLARRCACNVRAFAALVAGSVYALWGGSLYYSSPGNGDHHAWIALLFALLLAFASRALEEDALGSRAAGARNGIALGLVAGVMMGSWVGALVYVALIQLAFGVALFANAKRPRRGLATLGVAFHLAWAASLAPAVLASPWKDAQPWMSINLSWLHLAHPLLGACIFLPLYVLPVASTAARRWPWIVAAALGALGVALALGDFALARGVRDGFAWASRQNTFMAFITESQPLAWGQIGGFSALAASLGLGALVLAPLWVWLASKAWRGKQLELAPLVIALPPLAAQALVQRRFADALGIAAAIATGYALACWLPQRTKQLRVAPLLALGLVVALVVQAPTLATLAVTNGADGRAARAVDEQKYRGYRELYDWLRENSAREGPFAVLASWDHGHSIEWVAERATIATNFGSYLGEDSWLDPWRFFLETDVVRAEATLEARRARYVLITGEFTKDLEVMLSVLRPAERRSYLLIQPGKPVWGSQRFFDTMAARTMLFGRVGDLAQRTLVGDSLNFLRLVHISPTTLLVPPPVRHTNDALPAGWIWEHVRGAQVEARGAPGETFTLSLDVMFKATNTRLSWVGNAVADTAGLARVRVPYCTDGANGDARALGLAQWQLGAKHGQLVVPEHAVQLGERVEIR